MLVNHYTYGVGDIFDRPDGSNCGDMHVRLVRVPDRVDR
jgi:hypothetical protein